MLRDITIGQYFPGDSIIHKLDPRFKIVITLLYIIMLFSGGNYICLAVGAVFTFGVILLSRIPLKMFFKSVKPLLIFLIITAFLNLFLMSTGDVLWEWKFLKITDKGLETSIFMIVRIVLLVMGSSVLTYTTSPITLTDAIERLLSPLRKIKFPVHELAMMMSIALRFIPTLIEETDKIMSAQKARGAEIDTGSFTTRAKNLISILVPLFISAFRRADERATARECRC
jgi:energy-coupling factor transport system permease protein